MKKPEKISSQAFLICVIFKSVKMTAIPLGNIDSNKVADRVQKF